MRCGLRQRLIERGQQLGFRIVSGPRHGGQQKGRLQSQKGLQLAGILRKLNHVGGRFCLPVGEPLFSLNILSTMQVDELAGVLEAMVPQVHGELIHLAALDGEEGPGTPSLRGQLETRAFTIALFDVPGPRDHFTLVVDATLTFSLSLHKEGRWDWLRKAMGQLDDYEIGFSRLDKEFIIGGHPQPAVVAYLKRPEVQERLERMDGFLSLGADHGMMRATYPLQREAAWTAEDLIQLTRGLAELAQLAEEI